jgi:uncharacterized protein YbaP (TraB family)
LRNTTDRGFLWRISKDGRQSYLYGTVHVAKLDWLYPGPTVLRALRASDTLALELDMLDAQIQRRMAEGISARGNVELPEALRLRLQRQMRDQCVAPEALATLIPEMQVATLTLLAARRDGLDPAYGIDLFLAGLAHGAGMPVVSLETPELQLAALQAQDAQTLVEFVDTGLADLEAGRARRMLTRMAGIWAAADHTELTRYDAWCECRKTVADRAVMKRLLDDRNPALAERIDELHAGGNQVFAALGSLHMIGTEGLPSLMQLRGYKVERVDAKP